MTRQRFGAAFVRDTQWSIYQASAKAPSAQHRLILAVTILQRFPALSSQDGQLLVATQLVMRATTLRAAECVSLRPARSARKKRRSRAVLRHGVSEPCSLTATWWPWTRRGVLETVFWPCVCRFAGARRGTAPRVACLGSSLRVNGTRAWLANAPRGSPRRS